MIDGSVLSAGCLDAVNGYMERNPFDALADSLRELAEFVSLVCGADYTRKSELACGGTIGGHVRHCLDHIELLLTGVEEGLVDYDRRERGTKVERCSREAFDSARRLEVRIRGLSPALVDQEIRVRGLVHPSLPALEFPSTIGRELMFVISHTTHHNAMIAAAARRMGVSPPADFGYAPSTMAYLNRIECAPSPSSR